ncbi:hypothetical protein O3M35_000760 [Rhynocoris fuscipes]|uniref:Cytochrome P450 315A1 n=1 Tax=Rhynocoris fuscipes TaxID=488301 RepID=A0AAW1DTA4_9HEMI
MKRFSNIFKSGNKFVQSKLNFYTIGEYFTTIPVRKGYPIIGTALTIMANGSAPKLHLHIDKGHKLLGPIFKENMGTATAIFISDPSYIREIFKLEGKYPKHFLPKPWTTFNDKYSCKRGLFFMDDEEWLHYRRMMNKHFLKDDLITNLKPIHEAVVNRLIKRWKNYDGNEIKNLEHEFYRHSISFLIGSLIGSSYIKYIDCYEEDVEKLASLFHHIFATTSELNGMPVKLMSWLSLPSWKRFEQSVKCSLEACHEVVDKMIVMRSPDGLLERLLLENLPMSIIEAIVVDLILAAGDTTAITSQWSLYLLSGHKDVQQSLVEGTCDVKNVVKEALRLYPPAVFISRIMQYETNIDNHVIPKNHLVLLSMYTAGRDDRIYPSANTFNPNRWVRPTNGREYEAVNDPRAYIPFAIGARSCIGKNLALAQLHYTISEIIANFQLELKEEVEMVLRLVPVPSKPIKINIKSRK